jgi:hypothetical protein
MDSLSETSITPQEESVALGQLVRVTSFCATVEKVELISAVWTLGPNWPNNGEIDIMEGVNLLTKNAATLHT